MGKNKGAKRIVAASPFDAKTECLTGQYSPVPFNSPFHSRLLIRHFLTRQKRPLPQFEKQ